MNHRAPEPWDEYSTFLVDELLYPMALEMPGGRYAAIYPLAYTVAIITGTTGDRCSLDRRYCFHTQRAAETALVQWWMRGFRGEPEGWHRDTLTGRRRINGDPKTEHIAA